MKVLIIAGFLGAGKTSFIKEMVKKTKADIAVLENEYGEVGVDKSLLNDEINIWELTEGCVCCSMKSNFATSILTIANTINPEYLIVEPTGVGMLSNIIANIKQIEYENIQILPSITILDPACFEDYLLKFKEIYLDQIKYADHIILSKLDVKNDVDILDIIDKIKTINNIEISDKAYSEFDSDYFYELLHKDIKEIDISDIENVSNINFENLGIINAKLNSESDLVLFLENLIRGLYGDIFRAKGFINCTNQILRFDVVNKDYCITGASEDTDLKSVFIGQNINKTKLRSLLIPKVKLIY